MQEVIPQFSTGTVFLRIFIVVRRGDDLLVAARTGG